jgi:hypothetical protein
MMLILVIILFAGWGVDAWGVLLAVIAFAACPFLLLYLVRITPRNKGVLHGGGFEGADAAFGVVPLDPLDFIPKTSPGTDNDSRHNPIASANGPF